MKVENDVLHRRPGRHPGAPPAVGRLADRRRRPPDLPPGQGDEYLQARLAPVPRQARSTLRHPLPQAGRPDRRPPPGARPSSPRTVAWPATTASMFPTPSTPPKRMPMPSSARAYAGQQLTHAEQDRLHVLCDAGNGGHGQAKKGWGLPTPHGRRARRPRQAGPRARPGYRRRHLQPLHADRRPPARPAQPVRQQAQGRPLLPRSDPSAHPGYPHPRLRGHRQPGLRLVVSTTPRSACAPSSNTSPASTC